MATQTLTHEQRLQRINELRSQVRKFCLDIGNLLSIKGSTRFK